jgi:hypothetical protein
VARSTNVVFASPKWMISRAIAWASGMSVPTSSCSCRCAQLAVLVRRGSTTNSFAPLWTAFSTCWKKIGCASRGLPPQITMTSASSISW